MAIDSITLAAQAIYNKIQSQPKVSVPEPINTYTETVKFHDMVEAQFNRFSKMTPQQILSHVQDVKSSPFASSKAGIIGTTAQTLRESVSKQEQVSRRSLINEASLIDVLTATTEASNTIKTVVEVRNKFMEAFDKVMNMSI